MLILKPEFYTGIYNFLFTRIICITGWLQINFIMDAISFPNRPDSKATRIPERLQRRLESSVPRWKCSESGFPRAKLTEGLENIQNLFSEKKNALLLDCSFFFFFLRSKLFNGTNITYSNRDFGLLDVIAKYHLMSKWILLATVYNRWFFLCNTFSGFNLQVLYPH